MKSLYQEFDHIYGSYNPLLTAKLLSEKRCDKAINEYKGTESSDSNSSQERERNSSKMKIPRIIIDSYSSMGSPKRSRSKIEYKINDEPTLPMSPPRNRSQRGSRRISTSNSKRGSTESLDGLGKNTLGSLLDVPR